MTTRTRAIISVVAKAHNQIERDAQANNERIQDATRTAVRNAVEDATASDGRFDSHDWNWQRFCAAAIRQIEDMSDVKRGWWA